MVLELRIYNTIYLYRYVYKIYLYKSTLNFLNLKIISEDIYGRTFVLVPNQVLSSSEMTLSLNSQGFAQSHIEERRLPLMLYKRLT